MIRAIAFVCTLPLLGACVPTVPNSGVEAGSSGPTQFDIDRARREQALAGPIVRTTNGIVPPNATDIIPSSGIPQTGNTIAPGELQAAGIGTQAAAAPVTGADPLRTQGVQASPSNAVDPNNFQIASTGISSEQDFDSVSSERDIAADAALREQQQSVFQVIQPEALPERGNVGPNIVEYALSAPNRRGQEWYSRSILTTQARFERNCASYRSADDAQRDFLGRGGPRRDPRGIDPDGDGFACGWDPAPFRAAVGN